jgi:hypothetical protein
LRSHARASGWRHGWMFVAAARRQEGVRPVEYGNSKNAIPNFSPANPLIFPNRAKKIFAEIWSA